MKKFLFLICFIFLLTKGQSNICQSITGNWNTPSTWSCGYVPDCGTDIIIAAGTVVTVNIQVDLSHCGPLNIQIDGELNFSAGKKISLPTGSVVTLSSTGRLTSGGGGNSNLITIGSVDVWSSDYGPAVGPIIITEATPLPIELISFFAENNGENNLIKWSTATEANNDFFTIEKSNNGVEYEIVGIIEGAGNSSAIKYYSLVDDNPYSKTYYRLKQTDYDGKYTYSKIIFIETVELDFEFEVFPNPNDGSNIYAKIKANKDQKILVVINDVLGKQIYSKIIIYENQANVIYVIDPSEKLSPGIYMIIATSDNKIYSKKLVVK